MRDRGYEDEHRVFLQGLMCQGVLDFKEVNSLMDIALTNCKIPVPESKAERQEVLFKLIHDINEHLKDLQMTIRKGVDEDDGMNFFMLVSLSKRTDPLVQTQTVYTDSELEYVRLLATEILQDDDRSIPSSVALNMINLVEENGLRKFSMAQAEKAINKFLGSRWLKMLETGHLTLGVRFIGEMESWILQTLDGSVEKCKICRKIVIRGINCNCSMVYHRICATKLSRVTGGEFRCLGCNEKKTFDDQTSAEKNGAANQQNGRPGKRKSEENGHSPVEDGHTSGEEEEEDEEGKAQENKNPRRRRAMVMSSSDED